MGDWKIPMPRENPPKDTVDYRIGFKRATGFSCELDGRISQSAYKKITRILQKEGVHCPRNVTGLHK